MQFAKMLTCALLSLCSTAASQCLVRPLATNIKGVTVSGASCPPNPCDLSESAMSAGARAVAQMYRASNKFSPPSRLLDWSWAGANFGDNRKAPPAQTGLKNIKTTYGAKGDGRTDDSNAFLNAIKDVREKSNMDPVKIYVPAGTYVIRKQIWVPGWNSLVMIGAGRDKTTLFFPDPLCKMQDRPCGPFLDFKQHSGSHVISHEDLLGGPFSFSGSVIRVGCCEFIWGNQFGNVDASATKRLFRGTSVIPLKQPYPSKKTIDEKLSSYGVKDSVGRPVIEIRAKMDAQGRAWFDTLHGMSSVDQVINSCDIVNKLTRSGQYVIKFRSPVAKYEMAGSTVKAIHLARPLAFNISFDAEVAVATRHSAGNIIQDLTIRFPAVKYDGHWQEKGYNGIQFNGVKDSWIYNVDIVNADTGMFLYSHSTNVQKVRILSFRPPCAEGLRGHYGICIGGNDNYIADVTFNTSLFHDMSVYLFASLNVFNNIKGPNLNCDHHKTAPYGNLWSSINVGKGERIFSSGGGSCSGPYAGALDMYYNIFTENGDKRVSLGACPNCESSSLPEKWGSKVSIVGGSWRLGRDFDKAKADRANMAKLIQSWKKYSTDWVILTNDMVPDNRPNCASHPFMYPRDIHLAMYIARKAKWFQTTCNNMSEIIIT